jgi:transposase-like protein
MRTNHHFSKEFKEAIVKKLISRGNKTIEQFCTENNIARSTVTTWQTNCANVLEMKHKKDKSKYSAEKVLKIISETYSLNEEDLGIYLRKNGLHTNQLTEWRTSFLTSVNQPKLNLNKKDERDIEIKDLKKNLRKKDAALAEVSALLILQKKANLLWPSPNEDEDL